ncbi:hypothetical protein LOTGIDRAFT_169762 [Lottia gigantea]|uniref:Uncharacterized protein n=1 Tax=Lottia gigantea TaxID=225164 RepID=V3ZFR3_LOTGI|nr:hypothetical protein LOTGIDRAFT_169762 [Lottia gigantea]ESO82942.1 hypothetical protein LOTGIDRAFT_169762 [Lottia gigantea]
MPVNFVHNDEIWKDHVHHETFSQLRVWPDRWGYLVREYESLNLILEGKEPLPPMPPTKFEDRGKIKFPPIVQSHIPTRPKDFPRSTAQLIGWRVKSDNVVYDMNKKCNTKTKGKSGMLRVFNWPREAAA